MSNDTKPSKNQTKTYFFLTLQLIHSIFQMMSQAWMTAKNGHGPPSQPLKSKL